MADYVTDEGFQPKTLQDILTDLATRQRADIDPTLNTDPDSPIGEMNAIFAAQLREVWEVLAEAYAAFDPDSAFGTFLIKLCALTGTVKRGATKGTVTLDCTLTVGTTLIAGTHFASVVGEPSNRWTPKLDFTAPSTGVQSVEFEAELAGATVANAGTITVIATPVSGWTAVTNALDADEGTEADTDAQLRERREQELAHSGSSTIDAIRADLLALEVDGAFPVKQCTVLENVTDEVDGLGLPPKSIEVIVFLDPNPGDDPIAQAIWDTKSGGIATHGNDLGTAVDSQGNEHSIRFSEPTEKEVYLEIDIDVVEDDGYPGDTYVKEQVAALNDSRLLMARDVVISHIVQVVSAIQAVADVTEVRAGFAASPSGTVNLAIATREIARLDTSRIVINRTDIGDYP